MNVAIFSCSTFALLLPQAQNHSILSYDVTNDLSAHIPPASQTKCELLLNIIATPPLRLSDLRLNKPLSPHYHRDLHDVQRDLNESAFNHLLAPVHHQHQTLGNPVLSLILMKLS